MRRPLSLLCIAALAATGLAVSGPAVAAPPPPAGQAAAAVPDELLVGYVAGANAQDRERARSRAGAQRQEQVVQAGADRTAVELVRLPRGKDREQAIGELESDPAVAYAEPNWLYTHQATSSDPYFTDGRLWGMYGDAGAPSNRYGSQAAEAWAAGHLGTAPATGTVLIGVIDEGIQYDHPDLAGQVWTNPYDAPGDGVDNDGNGYVDDVHGWDFDGDDNTVYDGGTRGSLDDHGTHVSGTIAAASNTEGVVGVSWGAQLISGKFLGRRGGSLADAVQAVDYFTDLKTRHGLNLVATSNSWGGGGFSQAMLDAIVRAAEREILFVAAAGNSGTDNDTDASYPSNYDTTAAAGYDAVVAVAAIDSTGELASFSQYGAQTVDLGAPGVGIWSTTAYNGYSSYNGTSMATPHVTGAVALYTAANPGSSAADVRQALLSSTAATASLAGRTVTGGRLDAGALLVPPAPASPGADFTSSCSGLSCTFTDTSTGTPTSWTWSIEGQQVATTPTYTHTFAAAGTYEVTLAVANALGSDSRTQDVTVSESVPEVTVTAGQKKRGVTPVTVTWKGFAGAEVDVTRSGSTFATANDGSLTENWSGTGTVTYTICETGSTRCASGSTTI
ncbi:MAG: S8 family serine peptidase [Mycobacteriales bacterium]